MITVKHSGNVGDIIYSMPSLQYLSNTTNQLIKFYLNVNAEFMSIELATALKPLLEHQSYIDSVEMYSGEYIDYDLDMFREFHKSGDNLGESHAKIFNFDASILNTQSIYIDHSYEITLPVYDIIINRTMRYNNPEFPWETVLNEQYADHTKCFVGNKTEYDTFVNSFNVDVNYVPTANFLQVGFLINKSKIFIGNCSSPYAIAETMKHMSIQESCTWCLSCLYKRPNAYYFTDNFFQIN